jgi:peptide/nickel transport system permease protein
VTAVDVGALAAETAPGEAAGRRRFPATGIAIACAWLLVVALLAIFANVLPFVQDPYAIDPLNGKAGPSLAHWFGTDALGRDTFARCVYGARTTFLITLCALGIALLVGGTLGMLVGYYRGRLETGVMTLTDIVLAFPGIVLLLGVLTFMGQSVRNVTLALALLATPGLVRVTRANTLRYGDRLFVLAARTLGASDRRIIVREILPNIVPPIAGLALVILGVLVIAEGGLSFLGLGVPLPRPTWGGMIAAGIPDLQVAPMMTFFPAGVLFLTVLSFNILGEALRSRFEGGESRA